MDKKQFCDEATVKLRELDRYFQLQKGVSAATAEKAAQVKKEGPRREEARARVETLLVWVNAVCADAAPLTDAVQTQIESEFAAIRQLLR
jgi:hypothetical protein